MKETFKKLTKLAVPAMVMVIVLWLFSAYGSTTTNGATVDFGFAENESLTLYVAVILIAYLLCILSYAAGIVGFTVSCAKEYKKEKTLHPLRELFEVYMQAAIPMALAFVSGWLSSVTAKQSRQGIVDIGESTVSPISLALALVFFLIFLTGLIGTLCVGFPKPQKHD